MLQCAFTSEFTEYVEFDRPRDWQIQISTATFLRWYFCGCPWIPEALSEGEKQDTLSLKKDIQQKIALHPKAFWKLYKKAPRLDPCLLGVHLLMTTQTTSPTVACLTLTNCEVSPQHIPNNVCVSVSVRETVRKQEVILAHICGWKWNLIFKAAVDTCTTYCPRIENIFFAAVTAPL